MAYFVFQVSDQSAYGKQRTAREVFDFLVVQRNAWGFGSHTPNRKAVQPGDKILFYLTGGANQVFVGSATLVKAPYEDKGEESKDWYLDPDTLRLDLTDVQVFAEPLPRKSFVSISWVPAQGGSSKISEHDYQVITGLIADRVESTTEIVDNEAEFVLEKYLEEFIVSNWKSIDFGEKLELFVDEDGNSGQQYYTEEVGYIDILARDKDGGFVVIELKKGRKDDEVVGQVLRYMGWVRNNLATKRQDVRGLIIVGDRDKKLDYALKEMDHKIQAKIYQISFKLHEY